MYAKKFVLNYKTFSQINYDCKIKHKKKINFEHILYIQILIL